MNPYGFTDTGSWGTRQTARRISDAVPRGRVVVTGTVRTTGVTMFHGIASYECTIDDGSGGIGLRFPGRRRVAGLVAGRRCTIEGTSRVEDGRLVVWNPRYRLEPDDH